MTNPIDGVFEVMLSELEEGEPIVLSTLVYRRLNDTKLVDFIDIPEASCILPKWNSHRVFWSPSAPSDPKKIISYSRANARKIEEEVADMLADKGVTLP